MLGCGVACAGRVCQEGDQPLYGGAGDINYHLKL